MTENTHTHTTPAGRRNGKRRPVLCYLFYYGEDGGGCGVIRPFLKARQARKYARRNKDRHNYVVIFAPNHTIAHKWAGEYWQQISKDKGAAMLIKRGQNVIAYVAPWRLCVFATESPDEEGNGREVVRMGNLDQWAYVCPESMGEAAIRYRHPAEANNGGPLSNWSPFAAEECAVRVAPWHCGN